MIQNPAQASHVYNDIHSLQSIKSLNKNAALMETAKQFESMFMNMMLKSMRAANAVFEEDSLFHSSQMEFFQGMYDDQLALSMSSGKGMGLAKNIYQQLERAYGEKSPEVEIDQSRLFNRTGAGEKMYSLHLAPTIQEVEALRAKRQIQPLRDEPAVYRTKPDTGKTPEPFIAAPSIAQGEGNKGQQFATAEEFVAALYPAAEKIAAEIGVDAKAMVAQAALETGWGRYMITDKQGNNSFNFFGIKADKRWQGEKVEIMTHEFRDGVKLNEKAEFRSYENLEEGLRDYGRFLKEGRRYQQAIGKNLTAEHYGFALQQAGYATDPDYGAKIKRIASSDTLNNALNQLQQGK